MERSNNLERSNACQEEAMSRDHLCALRRRQRTERYTAGAASPFPDRIAP